MSKRYNFGRFELRPTERELLDDGCPLAIGARAFDLLLTLIERRERLVSKAELLDLVWPGLVVEEGNLPVQVSGLRKLLGPGVVATIPGRGYRFAMSLDDADVSPRPQPQMAMSMPRTNVPAAFDILLGRDADVDELQRWLAQYRLVTVLGAGGMGKTRVAQAVARASAGAYAHGVWWVDLAALSATDKIALAIADAAHLQLGAGEVGAQLIRVLGQRELLLVLDNCEHIAAEVAALVQNVLASVPNVHVLATSQVALKTAGEHLYMLSPLAVPPSRVSIQTARSFAAVQLLECRAQASDRRFQLTDSTVSDAIEICRQLDGVALAIEMAAARLPQLGLCALLARLSDRLFLLRSGSRSAPTRQQTLRATLDWSHSLLSTDEKAVFRRLAVFVGSFRLAAAQHVAEAPGLDANAVLDGLFGLAEKCMVETSADDPPRYRLLETSRAYASEQLLASGDSADAFRRHAEFFDRTFDAAFDAWLNTPEVEWWDAVRSEVDDLRSALRWSFGPNGNVRTGASLAAASLPVWLGRDAHFQAEGHDFVQTALNRMTPDVPSIVDARLHVALGLLRPHIDFDQTLATLDRAIARCQLQNDESKELALILCVVQIERGRALCRTGRHAEAAEALDVAGNMLDAIAVPRLRGQHWQALGSLYQATGDPARSWSAHKEAIRIFERSGAESLALCAMNNAADAAWAEKDLAAACDGFTHAVDVARQFRFANANTVGHPLGNLAGVLLERGRIEESTPIVTEALSLLREAGTAWDFCDTLALWLALTGSHEGAARVQGFVDATYKVAGETRQPNEARLRLMTFEHLTRVLDVGMLNAMLQAGAGLTEGDAFGIALASLAAMKAQ